MRESDKYLENGFVGTQLFLDRYIINQKDQQLDTRELLIANGYNMIIESCRDHGESAACLKQLEGVAESLRCEAKGTFLAILPRGERGMQGGSVFVPAPSQLGPDRLFGRR